MKNVRNIFLLLSFVMLAVSCKEDMEDMTDDNMNDDGSSLNIVEMTVANDGASAYFVSDVIGNEEVSALNENNSAWQLTIGTRYEITVTGASSHPFALRDSANDILLSMNSVVGSFESDDAVNFTTDGSSFNFTLTQKLADQLDKYVCTIHLGMNGSVTIN